MKIDEIKELGDSTYSVKLKPNWFERIFGVVEYEEQYKYTGDKYTYGGGRVYFRKDGSSLGNGNTIGEAIDNFLRKW